MPRRQQIVSVPELGTVPITIDDAGEGPTCLLLHPGAGPAAMTGFAALLASRGMRTIVPTHPGFDGTERPPQVRLPRDVGRLYAALLDELEVDDVLVIGNSVGGWIAAELALTSASRIARLVIVDGVGFDDPDNPEADTRTLSGEELVRISFYDPEPVLQAQASAPPAQLQAMRDNQQVLFDYAPTMVDPGLAARLDGLEGVPTLLLWGESDGVVTPAAGRTFARAIPGAEFRLLRGTGHMPQLETPEVLYDAIFDQPTT